MWRAGSSAPTAAIAALAGAAAATLAVNSRGIARRLFASSASRNVAITRRRPANVGELLESVETPCLVVDLDAMETNLAALPRSLQDVAPRVAIRPHAKAHKCAEIGRLQLEHSRAVGLCSDACFWIERMCRRIVLPNIG